MYFSAILWLAPAAAAAAACVSLGLLLVCRRPARWDDDRGGASVLKIGRRLQKPAEHRLSSPRQLLL